MIKLKSLVNEVINTKYNPSFEVDDVEEVDMTYTLQGGMFYGVYIYLKSSTKRIRNWDVKLRQPEDADMFLKEWGINIKMPNFYDQPILKRIAAQLEAKGIKASYDSGFDVSW